MTFDDLAYALGRPGQPGHGLRVLDATAAELIGHNLFTVLVLDHAQGVNRRFYSSRPEEYPVGGYKPIDQTSEFYQQVVKTGEPRFCDDRDALVRAFPDHTLILSLGCQSAVNMPVRFDGRTLGSLNLLHPTPGRYRQYGRARLNVLAGLAIPLLQRILEGPAP